MKLHSFQLNDDSMINIVAAARAEEEFSISKTPRQYEDKNFPYRPSRCRSFWLHLGQTMTDADWEANWKYKLNMSKFKTREKVDLKVLLK